MPRKDPLEELYRVRDALAARFNYDIEALCAHLRARQRAGKRPVVRLKARKPVETGAGKAA